MLRPVYLSLLLVAPVALGSWPWPWAKKNTAPEQIHIAFAGKDGSGAPSGMRIAWFTHDKPSDASTVKYGVKSGELTKKAAATEAPVEYLKGHGYHHVVTVTELPPSTQHYYEVGSDTDGWSKEWSFKSAPSGSEAAKTPITVSIFGDMGYEDSDKRPMQVAVAGLEKKWSATVTRDRLMALKDEFDVVWHLGDIGYADDSFGHSVLGFTYEDCYNGFMNWIQDLAATMPYMVSPGNHESECHSPRCLASSVVGSTGDKLRNFSAYNARWHMPSAESVGVDRTHSMWHSWNHGPVHFVSINTETDWAGAEERTTGDSHVPWLKAGHFDADGAYLRWLEADLKAAAEARAKARSGNGDGPLWIVAGGHRPYGDIKKEHVPLFEKYGVDLYVAGHSHSYTRSTPVNKITYITVGGAGCDEMSNDYDSSGLEDTGTCVPSGDAKSCEPGYAVPEGAEGYHTKRMASGVLKADASELNWQLIDSKTGDVLDKVTIKLPGTESTIV